jgi:hypothetical protein
LHLTVIECTVESPGTENGFDVGVLSNSPFSFLLDIEIPGGTPPGTTDYPFTVPVSVANQLDAFYSSQSASGGSAPVTCSFSFTITPAH